MSVEVGRRVLTLEAEAILDLLPRMDARFEAAVQLCCACRGHVVVIGMGKSGLIGKKIAATLASTGTPAFFLHPAEGIHGDLGMVGKEDVALAISNSGETEELLRILPSIKRLGLPLIGMTGNVNATLAKMSDVVLDVAVREEACPLGLAPTASTTATLAMGDALAVSVLQKKGFRREDFASFHPGGNLGRNLLLTVGDVMHTGDAVPRVAEGTSMREVVLEMTAKRLGMAVVVGPTGRLSGIITDGDLRRCMVPPPDHSKPSHSKPDHPNAFFSLPASEVMNRNPKTTLARTLAMQAVYVMESHAITVLIVSDADGGVAGVVHLHDLLKKGVV